MTVEAGIETYFASSNPKWIEKLSPAHRREYEIVKAEDIAENTERLTTVISEHLGNEVDEEKVALLAANLAVRLRKAHDGGVQVGMDELQPRLDRMQDEAHRLGYAITNLE